MTTRDFFVTCTRDLASLLEELVGVSGDSKFCLWSEYEETYEFKGNCIYLKCGKYYMKFSVIDGMLYPSDIDGFDYSDIKRITRVVRDCVTDISKYPKPIHSVCVKLENRSEIVTVKASKSEVGAYDVLIR